MARFIALPGRVNGQPEPGPTMWVNPSHIASLQPQLSELGDHHVELNVDVKLDGTPMFKTWFGRFPNRAAADERWQQFLSELDPGPR